MSDAWMGGKSQRDPLLATCDEEEVIFRPREGPRDKSDFVASEAGAIFANLAGHGAYYILVTVGGNGRGARSPIHRRDEQVRGNERP